MATLASSVSFITTPLSIPRIGPLPSSHVSTGGARPLVIEAAKHVRPKSTKGHTKNRPKKHAKWDKKRGGTREYGPFDRPPPIWSLDEGQAEAMGEEKNLVLQIETA
eukprot:TRINITY_DN26279_c0_g1_i1.p1 TRINITY_DN26279_c0_g1~~TRINITY_DN26279_c0_g1_i1.p1  ORF type:complete len:107 (+),score=10.89 TRINITY_DN26279_c0_g1_i1:201-521(+)